MKWHNTTHVFWESSGFEYESDFIVLGGAGEVTVHTRKKMDIAELPETLLGRAVSGEFISAHNATVVSSNTNSSVHNFDHANQSLIEDAEDYKTYTYRIRTPRCYIGDSYLDKRDPLVDSITVSSQDLFPFAAITWDKEESHDQQIFENTFVVISFFFSENLTTNRDESSRKRVYRLHFEFKESVEMQHALDNWVTPILSLLELIAGGEIVEDEVVITSKERGARFSPVWFWNSSRRQIKNEPAIDSPLVRFKTISEYMSSIISTWMEKPNPLRWISHYYSSTVFGGGYLEDKFTTSMRLAEAAYASYKLPKDSISLRENGMFNLRDSDFRNYRKEMKNLSSRKYSFKQKLNYLAEKFNWLVCHEKCSSIDWEQCLRTCKNMRDGYSHGTVFEGIAQTKSDYLFAFMKLGILFYEASAIEHFSLPEAIELECLTNIARRNHFDISIASIWGAN